MDDSLFFRRSGSEYEWLRFDIQGQLLAKGTSELEDLSFEGPAVYVVPGPDVLVTSAAVPSRQYRKIVQAVPYVIEEDLAIDVEDCFFALGNRNAGGDIEVAVVNLDNMRTWSEELENSSVNVAVFVAEHELVNANDENAVVLDNGQAHIDFVGKCSFTLPENELPLAVAAIEGEAIINVWSNEAIADTTHSHVKEIEASGLQVKLQHSTESSFERLCRGYLGREINLLQGAFKKREPRSEVFTIWKPVIMLATAALLVHVLGLVGQGWYLHSKAADFNEEAKAIYSKTFPEDRNVRDIRRRWDSHIGKQRATGSVFLGLFSRSARQLSSSGLSLVNVNFNESRGDLILQVLGKRSEALVEYSQQLSGQGLDVEIGTITQDSDGFRGSLRVRDSS